MSLTPLRQAQLLEKKLLDVVVDICKKENLQYYLLGGTALGAIRHEGFIPWDDDIDVGMPRKDYDKFIEVASKYTGNGVELYHYSSKEGYADYTAKLVSTHSYFVTEREGGSSVQQIWIDVFPIDGSPNSSLLRWLHYRKLDVLRGLLAIRYIDQVHINHNRSKAKIMIINIAKKIPLGRLINPIKVCSIIDLVFRANDISKSIYAGNYMSPYHERDMFNSKIFGSGTMVRFEGDQYYAPELVHEYLNHLYGDYMKLPPIDQQFPKHQILDIQIQEK